MQPRSPLVTGTGVLSAVGQGTSAFADALFAGQSAFRVMQRPGRQHNSAYLGAEVGEIALPAGTRPQAVRTASLSAHAALAVLGEAWTAARLSEVDPRRIGLVVGGSNVQQRELTCIHEKYRESAEFLRPTYALAFLDSDLCGFATEHFGIRGLACTVGGASASGQVAIIEAARAILTNEVDVCIALGALMDLSHWECRGLRAIGAMGSDRYADSPSLACRPFDRGRDGFIYGEACAAIVLESPESTRRRGVEPLAALRGWGVALDGNRNPNPSFEGEVDAIEKALHLAGWSAADVDYVNPHGTGSPDGDDTELRALRACGLDGVFLNATKSLIGHSLSAAGTVEVVATLEQMKAGRLHPTRNLDEPIDADLNWVRDEAIDHAISKALTMSMGFGGINTALCWENLASGGVS